MRDYTLLIMDNLSILNPLSQAKKADLYGYSAQARFGDNITPKPDPLNLIETVKWNNWNDKKGMKPQVAKLKWLEIVEPLIKKKDLPLC